MRLLILNHRGYPGLPLHGQAIGQHDLLLPGTCKNCIIFMVYTIHQVGIVCPGFILDLKEEAYAMMGDYLEFSLKEAALRGFSTIHLAGMWAKIIKAALRVPQTHVRNGILEMEDAANLLAQLGAEGKLLRKINQANTAREMYEHIQKAKRTELVTGVCTKAKQYCEDVTSRKIKVYLINHKAEVIANV